MIKRQDHLSLRTISVATFQNFWISKLILKFAEKEVGGVDINKCHHKFGGKV